MSELLKEVPSPGAVFWESVTHPDNLTILQGDEKSRKLPKDKLKQAERKLWQLQSSLNEYLHAYLRYLDCQKVEIERGERPESELAHIEGRKVEAQRRIERARHLRRNPYRVRTMGQAKETLTLIHRLKARIREHWNAVENARIRQKLAEEMQTEISFYGNQCVDRWTALGYREEYYVNGKRFLRRVRFEEAHFTEDSIQFKIYVSHLTLLGNTVHHLPDRVKAWDLVKPETLMELEAACECPVTSPHVDNDGGEKQGFEKGAWLEIHRVGMRDGLFSYVELETVITKYNQALRPHFALPVGIKSGRVIEYLHLDSVPHIMFNGITGSGKTNLARVFLATACQFYSPDEIRLILIDLKRSGDLNHFAHVPHLVGEIVKDVSKLEELLPQIVALMHERMRCLSEVNAFGINEYNAIVKPEARMQRVLVLIDECGSINDLSTSKEQKETIWRCLALLAAQARAAGIQLMLGTQQPGREVIPTRVTNNITYTISFRQRTTSGAMMALGNNKLKELPAIKGRGLVDNGFAFIAVQTPYAAEKSIATSVAIAKDYPAPRPFLLPGATAVEDEDTSEIDAVEIVKGVTRERVIEIALESYEGILSSQKIYELTGKITPERTIRGLIKALAHEGEFTHAGRGYKVVVHGKGYRIMQNGETTSGGVEDAAVSDAVLPAVSDENEELERAV